MVPLPFEALAEARLILTDDLIRDALRRTKRREEAKKTPRRKGGNEIARRSPRKTPRRKIEFTAGGKAGRQGQGRRKWQSVQTGLNSCRSRMRSRAKSRSTSRSCIAAMADAIQKAARSRYGQETNIRADINPNTGEMKLQRLMEVVETVEDYAPPDRAEVARDRNPDAQVGDFIAEQLPPMDFGRIAAQSAKQVIVQKVREAERDRQFDEYKDRVGEIVNGTVKRVEYGNVIVDLGRGEAIIRRDELIPRENFNYGDRVRAYVYDVRREQRGPQIFLSRTHPQFMAKLFTMEVPEIYDGIIEIKSVARDPGSRAKIAVISRDSSIDPVGACVGMRGSRVQAVVGELAGREDRHHSVVAGSGVLHRQRAAAGRSRQGRARRGCGAHRGRRAGRPAFAGHRPPRPERAPGLAADRLGYRHPDRAGRIRAPPEGIQANASNLFMEALECRRDGRPGACFRGLRQRRGTGLRRARRDRLDRWLRRGYGVRDPDPCPRISRAHRGRTRCQAQGTRRCRRTARHSRHDRRDDGRRSARTA